MWIELHKVPKPKQNIWSDFMNIIGAIFTKIIKRDILARLKNSVTIILAESDTSVLSNVKITYNHNK